MKIKLRALNAKLNAYVASRLLSSYSSISRWVWVAAANNGDGDDNDDDDVGKFQLRIT